MAAEEVVEEGAGACWVPEEGEAVAAAVEGSGAVEAEAIRTPPKHSRKSCSKNSM